MSVEEEGFHSAGEGEPWTPPRDPAPEAEQEEAAPAEQWPENDPANPSVAEAPVFEAEEIAPEDFFRDFQNYLRQSLEALRAETQEARALLAATLVKRIEAMHTDVLHAVGHLGELAASELMDARYVTQPPDPYVYELANRCQYVEAPNLALLQAAATAGAAHVVELRCDRGDVGVQITESIKRNETVYFFVEACAHHRYKVESLPFVSVRERYMVRATRDEQELYMFYYLVKRGL